uniref:Ig-like domain-containing protein n=1 Tax=Oryzias melastigma TaxID=30732 RepID=A0A3B3CG77_ORYME
MEEWTRGSNFTCKFIHKESRDEKTTSICHIFGFNPPSIHVEIPSFKTVMMTNSDVKATCFIHNVDAELVWLMDGKTPSTDKIKNTSNKTTVISELTVPSSSWKNLKLLKCKVQHHCFTAEKIVEVSGPSVPAPQVNIRRSLSDLQKQHDDFKLHCDLSQLSSQHIYVTLQSKGADISDKQYVDLPEAPASHTVSVSFSVPQSYWKSDQSFSCKVHQGFSSQSFESKAISVSDPSVEVLQVSSKESGKQKLLCSGSGFNPHINWFSDSESKSASSTDVSMDPNGRVTVISRLDVLQTEWKTGKTFTCEVFDRFLEKSDKKDISLCSVFGFNPPSFHVEIPSFKTVMMTNSDVKATCFLHNVDAELVWLMDGKQPSTDRVNEFSNKTTVISELTVPSSSWKNLKLLKCKVQHHCFTAEKTVEVSGPSVPAPQVNIRRSLSDLQKQHNDFKLHCDLSQLSSQHIYVTLQSKGADISDKQYVDLPEAPASHTVSVSFSVPQSYWKSDQSFSCKVHQGFSSQSFESKAISVSDPSVEVLQVSSRESGKQKLLCSGSGFNPQINWFFNLEPKSASSTDVSMDPNGRVTVISRLDVLQTEWKTGKTFTCEVFDGFLNKRIKKDINISSDFNPPTVRIVEPTAAELSVSDILTLTCLVSGYFPSTITVHWKENGQKLSSSRYINSPSFKDSDSSSYSMRSRLNVSQMNDKKSTYTCFVRHESSKTPFETSIKDVFASVIHSEPSAVLLQGSNELVCLVFGFSPASINITWIRDGSTELWNYNNSHPYRGPDGKFCIQSFLRLSPVDSLPGVNLTCRVTHGNTTLSVNVSRTDTLEQCHFFDDILHVDMSQDTVMQAWGVAIFFLLLFFISIIFSAVITSLKTK